MHGHMAKGHAGKLTISHMVAHQAAELNQLGTCFLLHHYYAKRRDPQLIVNTLAFHLAHFHPDIATGVKAALDKNTDLGAMDSIQIKFDHLILDPITAVNMLVEPVLLVINDLDSLDTKDGDARSQQQDFLSYISQHHQKFPPFLKVVITSRPEWDVVYALENLKPHILQHNSDDLMLLAKVLLDGVVKEFALQPSWPHSNILDALVQCSGDLFVWIKTTCQCITHRDPNSNPLTPEAMDSLLELSPDVSSKHTIKLFQSFLVITEGVVNIPIYSLFLIYLSLLLF